MVTINDGGVDPRERADHVPLFTVNLLRPVTAKIVEFGKALGLKVVLHCDGNLVPILDDIIECGFEGMHPLQPDADMDLRRVKEYVARRLCLIGNISVTEVLPRGSPWRC